MENQNDQVLVTRKTELTGAQKAGYLFAGLLGGAASARWRGMRHLGIPVQHRRAVPLGLHQVRAHRPRHPNRAVGYRLHRDAALHGDALLITR